MIKVSRFALDHAFHHSANKQIVGVLTKYASVSGKRLDAEGTNERHCLDFLPALLVEDALASRVVET